MTRQRIAGLAIILLAMAVNPAPAQAPPPTPAPATPAPAPAPSPTAPAPAATPPAPALDPPTLTLPAPLARVLADYETAWRKKDAAGLAALFSEDGFVMSSGAPPARGRAEIEKRYQGHGGPLYLRAYAFAADGAIAWILGGYTGRAGAPDDGKFTLTLRKGPDGRWLIHSDMDNSNARR